MNFIHVKNSTIVLAIDVELEINRSKLYWPLLVRWGSEYPHEPFDYSKYQALDPMDRCFDNAIETAQKYNLLYVEGLMIFDTEYGELPVAHGWCVDVNGRVVDPTCHKYQGVVDVQYMGLPIKKAYAEWWKREIGYYGCLDGEQMALLDPKQQRRGIHVDDAYKWLDKPGYRDAH